LQLRGDTAVSDADSGKGFECLVCATNYRRVMNAVGTASSAWHAARIPRHSRN
jgi:hypothetical protein